MVDPPGALERYVVGLVPAVLGAIALYLAGRQSRRSTIERTVAELLEDALERQVGVGELHPGPENRPAAEPDGSGELIA